MEEDEGVEREASLHGNSSVAAVRGEKEERVTVVEHQQKRCLPP